MDTKLASTRRTVVTDFHIMERYQTWFSRDVNALNRDWDVINRDWDVVLRAER